ncbi:hypothetical protein H6F67_24675 [Microcoleus sp. FACHB-1515]|uniref:hypothetical protein n=1 Tax=Cyanophyceae TaxID=3028117 RepID=UPI001684324E|nr:hypothetical protein [Microcoleus sp. FACHB-1515]MBD2093047.1 hypothetical protein [Microcoleus sp. FACHB-1515]
MSHNLDKPKPFPQIAFKRKVFTLTIAALILTLFPFLAKAAPLDELSGTLNQTITNVTNSALNPIHQVGNTIEHGVDQVEGAIGNTIDQVTRPIDNVIGGINDAIDSFLRPFEQQLQRYIQAFNAFFQREFQRILGGIFGSSNDSNQSASSGDSGSTESGQPEGSGQPIPIETGAMGIPDFEANHAAIDQQVVEGAQNGFAPPRLQQSDLFNLNPVPLAQSMKAEQDRAENRGFAASVVGREGQEAMRQEAEAATHTLQAIQAKAQEAQSMDVTQDVMKNLTAMASQQSALQAGTYANLMALRQQEAANSLVTANISEGVDEGNRVHHAESMAGAISVMRGSANVYLPGADAH